MIHLRILSDNFEKQFCWDDNFYFFFFQVKKCPLVTFREKKEKN